MSEFSASWLALREPADRAARSRDLTERVSSHLRTGPAPLGILDLATGTGANIRYLAPCLSGPQRWRAVDRDAALLRQLPQRVGSWAIAAGYLITGDRSGFNLKGDGFQCRVDAVTADLARLAAGGPAGDLFEGRALVTASALLDLVSERWLATLAGRCQAAGAAVLFALTYDGRIACEPEEPEDEEVRDLVNRHQRGTKGFGRALGPDAVASAVRCFAAAGYEVHTAPSDWRLGPSDGELQRQLVEGWASAAREIAPARAAAVDAWHARRLAHVAAGRSSIMVGHQDLGGWPAPGSTPSGPDAAPRS
ncbi:MAG: class I SAM-dependent methyltransferase [Vicinamibacterales bacterium]